MEGRKWEELNIDCLVNIFGRVGMESLLFDAPFVCKTWYNATLIPLCWQHLNFPRVISDSFKSRLVDEYRLQRFVATGLIKLVVNRSGGCAVSLVLPNYYTKEALVCVADGCPALKYLTLSNYQFWEVKEGIASFISKWKNLEMLRLGNSRNMEAILTQVSIHCNDFVGLEISGPFIGEDKARVLVTLLPNIKYLDLRQASLQRENLVTILKGCKKLEFFDARNCKGFKCDDEILNLASHIPTFMHEGSEEWFDDVFYDNYPPEFSDQVWFDDGFYDNSPLDDGFYDNSPPEVSDQVWFDDGFYDNSPPEVSDQVWFDDGFYDNSPPEVFDQVYDGYFSG